MMKGRIGKVFPTIVPDYPRRVKKICFQLFSLEEAGITNLICLCICARSFGLLFAKHIAMEFYPIYKICSVSGAFSRIGSLLETCRHGNVKIGRYQRDQASVLFTQRPGDVILLGPRMTVPAEKGRAEAP